ncbi:hypothetical protein [Rubrivivax sp. A210]|uniref:hypothetical protein n=1 Tax=Rubrivivax sp. A210 TaxID=2772301 RepID=UPI001918C170|nr:hypothetical protein [Rubrivivax sp. A210]
MVPRQPELAQGQEQRPQAQLHTIYVDEKGSLLNPQAGGGAKRQPCPIDLQPDAKPDDGDLANAARLEAVDAGAQEDEYVCAIIENFRKARQLDKTLELTLHIHGGLNSNWQSMSRSDLYASHMLKDHQYPVFIAWPSDGFGTYVDHVFRTRRGEKRSLFETFLLPPFIVLEDLTRAIVRLPVALGRELRETYTVSQAIDSKAEKDADARLEDLLKHKFNVISPPPHSGVLSSYWSFLNPVKLVGAPLVDGLGSGPWDEMLRRTDLVLSKASVFEGKPPREPNSAFDRGSYGATAVAKFLQKWSRWPQSQDVKVNLIAHSMGSIVALNVLSRFPGMRIDNIVFMAAAARIKDVEAVVVPWMERDKHRGARFFNLSLDPYNELAENSAWDAVPRGSLLNWIDNFLGEVNSFRDRTAGSWWNITRVARDVFPDVPLPPGAAGSEPASVRSRVTLKRFPIDANVGPQRHGDFNDFCFWHESFWSSDAKRPTIPFRRKVWFPPAGDLLSCVGQPLEDERPDFRAPAQSASR